MKITYSIAMAAAKDAANRSMRAAGRTAWNEEDLAAAHAEFDRLLPEFDTSPTGGEREVSETEFVAACFGVPIRSIT